MECREEIVINVFVFPTPNKEEVISSIMVFQRQTNLALRAEMGKHGNNVELQLDGHKEMDSLDYQCLLQYHQCGEAIAFRRIFVTSTKSCYFSLGEPF
jgi:hypothetical protein